MGKDHISGIQQIGIGVQNAQEAFDWYRTKFGMDCRLFEENGTVDKMLKYTGGEPHERHAMLTLSLQGGGGFEIWQYTSREPQPANQNIELGDLGIFCPKMNTRDVQGHYAQA